MASRREEQERRRAERLAAEQAESRAAQRRLYAGYIVAGGLTLAVVVGLVIVLASGDGGSGPDGTDLPEEAFIQINSGDTNGFEPDDREGTPPPPIAIGDLEEAADAAGCELDLDLAEEGNAHIAESDKVPEYKTDPPNSGDHVDSPLMQADGAYIEPVGSIYYVHSMEHGRVVIHYSSDLPEEDQLALKGIFDERPEGVVLTPNDEMPYEVAATAWTQLVGCPTYEGDATLDVIRDFRDVYIGKGPEDVPLVTG